jgi:HEPN domain-containing protein
VRKAEDDMIGAKVLEQSQPLLPDQICFHCQQSAEKYLKALLQDWGIEPPRTHDLAKLLSLLAPGDATLLTLHRGAISLTRYAVDVLYTEERATKKQAVAALRYAEKVRGEVRARLRLPL